MVINLLARSAEGFHKASDLGKSKDPQNKKLEGRTSRVGRRVFALWIRRRPLFFEVCRVVSRKRAVQTLPDFC